MRYLIAIFIVVSLALAPAPGACEVFRPADKDKYISIGIIFGTADYPTHRKPGAPIAWGWIFGFGYWEIYIPIQIDDGTCASANESGACPHCCR